MKIGITGHQEREGIRWSWVEQTIRSEMMQLRNVQRALSSLAVGSDQIFAEIALSMGIPVVAILPLEGYDRFFQGQAHSNYLRLLSHCELVHLRWSGDPEHAFFEAGKHIVDHCDLLFAVWDGAHAEGLGGTGDVVQYARMKTRSVLHIDPIAEAVNRP